MSNLAIHQHAPVGAPMGMLPPGLEGDYGTVRQLPLFEGIADGDLIMALQQGGIQIRRLERDMFILDAQTLSPAQAAPVVYVGAGQVAAAVFMENELAE